MLRFPLSIDRWSKYTAELWADKRRAECHECGDPLPDWVVEWDAKMAQEGNKLILAAIERMGGA